MKKLSLTILVAVGFSLPAIFVRLAGIHVGPLSTTIIFFIALLSAGLLLSWGVEAAEKHVAKGLAIAVLALITVLPEYAVDIYYSYQAGNQPGSEYVGFAAANMTGANRLLVGMAWPLIVLLYWWRSKKTGIDLHRENITEIGFLALSSLYSFVIVLKSRIDIFDTIVLVAIYFLYLWRTTKGTKEDAVEEAEVGPSAALTKLPKQRQYLVIISLAVYAAFVILLSAEPFAESLIASGKSLGFNKFLLIQWLAPLASEAPTVIVMILMTLALLPTSALSALISDKINQWTLLVGMIPLAYSIGLGDIGHLTLDARQGEEFFLTAAQSLFALSLLLCLRLSLKSAFALLTLFLVQLIIAFIYRNDEPKTITSLTWLSWIYLALTVAVTIFNRKCLMSAITQWRVKK